MFQNSRTCEKVKNQHEKREKKKKKIDNNEGGIFKININ